MTQEELDIKYILKYYYVVYSRLEATNGMAFALNVLGCWLFYTNEIVEEYCKFIKDLAYARRY